MPVRIGVPLTLGGLREKYHSPLYATAVGLALEGNFQETEKRADKGPENKAREKGSIFSRMAEWFKKEFF
jgi:cell division protein FtsA